MARIERIDSSDGIQCPHCGIMLRDLWDHDWGSREELETDCGACGEPILLSRRVSVDYTAKALKQSDRAL